MAKTTADLAEKKMKKSPKKVGGETTGKIADKRKRKAESTDEPPSKASRVSDDTPSYASLKKKKAVKDTKQEKKRAAKRDG